MTPDPTALKESRRHRALVSYLQAIPEVSLDTLDRTNILVRSCTLEEIDAALEEVDKRQQCPLERAINRWMGEEEQMCIAAMDEAWLPLRDLRYHKLKVQKHLSWRTHLVYNPAEIWQVCIGPIVAQGRIDWVIYHVQSMVTRRQGEYFRQNYRENRPVKPEKIGGLETNTFPHFRNPMGRMNEPACKIIAQSTEATLVTDASLQLHQAIRNSI